MRTACGRLRRLAHGRDRDLGPRRAGPPPAPALQRRLEDRGRRRAVLRALPRGRRDPRRPLHLPARRRPLPDRHQRRQPREDFAWFARARRRVRRRGDATRSTATRCSPSRGPTRAAIVAGLAGGGAAAAHADRGLELAGAEALVCGTGYTGEDGVELLLDARGARTASGTRCSPRARSRRAWAPATRCAWRSASTSTATTWTRAETRSRRVSAGAARRRRDSSAPRPSPPRVRAAPSRSWRRSSSPAAGIPRQGNAVVAGRRGGRRGHQRDPLAVPRRRDRHGLRPAELSEPGTELEIDVRGKRRPARIESKPLYRKESE